MTKEDLPLTPKPMDSFTAQDGARLFSMIDAGLKRISSSFEEFSNRLAITNRQNLEILNLLRLIEAESNESRVGRLQLEIEEAERERDIAERNLKAIEEKLNQKQNIKDQNVDTGEKLRAAAVAVVTDIDKQKNEKNAARLEDIKWTAIKTVITIVVGGMATGFIAFIWFLVQLYLNRGTP